MSSILFAGKKEATVQKLRGGYYTPKILCDYMVAWAIRSKKDNIIEPSCGDGNFIISLAERFKELDFSNTTKISAIEKDKNEITKARERVSIFDNMDIDWQNKDFFKAYKNLKKKRINVVLGNPPFIRFQNFDNESREIAFSHLRNAGYNPTKLSNTWSAFVQLSIELLSDGGRLAMVVPAEVLQVQYASELRKRITQQFEHVILVTFKKLVFPDIQQEVILLLADNKKSKLSPSCVFHTIEIEDEHDLRDETLEKKVLHSDTKHTCTDVKWTSFFLSHDEFENIYQLQKKKKLDILGKYASVNVGIVTGRNKFFIIDQESLDEYKLQDFVVPLVGKTGALNRLRFTKKDFNKFSKDNPAYLLKLQDVEESKFTNELKAYIRLGEEEGVNLGYKCRIRKRWYDVPSTHLSEGFLFRQIYKYPLLVSNNAKAACTDTIHRVILKDKSVDIVQLAASFTNSLTFAWSEILGRSYGGGVLELEPSEATNLPIPYTKDILLDADFINKQILDNNIYKVIEYVDQKLLIDYYGFSQEEVNLLRNTWEKLRDRRLYRSKS